MMEIENSTTYLKVKNDRLEYLGERYFRFSFEDDKTTQVCISCGDTKKGKSNTFGIYLITKMTFISNYFATGYVEPCSKEEYNEVFEKVVKMLR